MALTVGSNSWVTIAEADAILENNIGAEDWFNLPSTGTKGGLSRENVLVTAYQEIMGSSVVDVPADSTDSSVKQAQSEMALFVLNFYSEIQARRAAISSGLSEFSYSERTEKFNSRDGGGAPGLPANVIGLLNDYIQSNTTVELQT